MEKAHIRDVKIESDGKGCFRRVRIVFGLQRKLVN